MNGWLMWLIGGGAVVAWIVIAAARAIRRNEEIAAFIAEHGDGARLVTRSRPRPRRERSRRRREQPGRTIKFRMDPPAVAQGVDLAGLVDALTGMPLQREDGLRQCLRCRVFYQTHSYALIQAENGGRCVACSDKRLVKVPLVDPVAGCNAEATAVTLADYPQHLGQLVVFEGQVVDVIPSRGGKQYAVMFENATWSKGLKMVVPEKELPRLGGLAALNGLRGSTIRLRGLLRHHPLLGPQIMSSRPELEGVAV